MSTWTFLSKLGHLCPRDSCSKMNLESTGRVFRTHSNLHIRSFFWVHVHQQPILQWFQTTERNRRYHYFFFLSSGPDLFKQHFFLFINTQNWWSWYMIVVQKQASQYYVISWKFLWKKKPNIKKLLGTKKSISKMRCGYYWCSFVEGFRQEKYRNILQYLRRIS